MSPRTPTEIRAIEALNREFLSAIASASVDRQMALDALEYTLNDLLIEVCTDRSELEHYCDIMRERCLGLWDIRDANRAP